MLLRGIIKWEPSSNPICILADVGKHFMGPFSQKKDLSGSKFPAPRKVWLVRSRMSFGSHRDYSTGGEHEGENLITFHDRFQQRHTRVLSPMIKLITICFLIFLLTFCISKHCPGGEQPQPASSQKQGLQVYIQVQPGWGLKSVAPSAPFPADRILSPEISPPQVSSHHHLQNSPFALMKNENQICQSSLFHEEIFHHHDMPIPIAALLIHNYFKGTVCLSSTGNLGRNCGARTQHVTQWGSRWGENLGYQDVHKCVSIV